MLTIVSDLILTDSFLIKGNIENKYTRLSQVLDEHRRYFIKVRDASLVDLNSCERINTPLLHVNVDEILLAHEFLDQGGDPQQRDLAKNQSMHRVRELKTDYVKALGALREALTRFPEGIVMVWLPQVQIVEAVQLPQRLKASAQTQAKKGWLHARLTVAEAGERGFGLMGSSVFVANPPHTLNGVLQPLLPWLAQALAQYEGAKGFVERSARA